MFWSKMQEDIPNKCWRCGRDILRPGNNYQCSSGAWVFNGRVSDAIDQFNFVIGSKNTSEAQKKVAHKEASAHGFTLSAEKDIKKRRYTCPIGMEEKYLRDIEYTKGVRKLLKGLCDERDKTNQLIGGK